MCRAGSLRFGTPVEGSPDAPSMDVSTQDSALELQILGFPSAGKPGIMLQISANVQHGSLQRFLQTSTFVFEHRCVKRHPGKGSFWPPLLVRSVDKIATRLRRKRTTRSHFRIPCRAMGRKCLIAGEGASAKPQVCLSSFIGAQRKPTSGDIYIYIYIYEPNWGSDRGAP